MKFLLIKKSRRRVPRWDESVFERRKYRKV